MSVPSDDARLIRIEFRNFPQASGVRTSMAPTAHHPSRGRIESARCSAWLTVLLLGFVGCSARPETRSESSRETVLDSIVHIEPRMVAVPEAPRLDDSPSFQKRRIEIQGAHFYVIEEGNDPPLVLINGGPGNTLHSFIPHFSAAASFARVIYYDQRGTGLSDWIASPDGYSTAQAVEDLERLRSALGISRWFILGHSYGGVIAQWYALRYPEHLLGMVLVGSSVPIEGLDLGERDYRSDAERARIRAVYAIDGAAVVPVHSDQVDLTLLREMIFNGYLNGDWKRQFFFKPSRERMAQIARYEWVHDRDFNRQVRQDGFATNLRGVFRDTPVPTLIIEGAYDANWGPDKPVLFAAEHPNAKLVIIELASHFPFAEQPDAFFAELERFLSDAPSVDQARIADWKASIGALP